MTPPIVDTDIWVYLILSGYYERIIAYYGYLQFSDVVEKEILKWQSNTQEFSNVARVFKNLKDQHDVRVIHFDDFDALSQASINHTLSEYGLKTVDILKKTKVNLQVYYTPYIKTYIDLKQTIESSKKKLKTH